MPSERPSKRACACGVVYDLAARGPIPDKCPKCRTPRYKRQASLRRAGESVASSAAKANRKVGTESEATDDHERRGNVLTCEIDYTDEEREFILAMERYKRERKRPFPSFTEVLAVARALGYRRVAEPTALPGAK